MKDYQERKYLSAVEAAKYLGITVDQLHGLGDAGEIKFMLAASGQKRFDLSGLQEYEKSSPRFSLTSAQPDLPEENLLELNGAVHKIYLKSSERMEQLADESLHLMVTSPPYFDAKMYGKEPREDDLGNVHDLDQWFERISKVWQEVFRVLQPGRKAFINIMNLPIRENNGFRSLNLVGRTIDLLEQIGFVFKRDIVWHKTNGVRAHFGTYPYPGGILINNMHEFILEFDKPSRKGFQKYAHLSKEQKEASRLDKEFWLSIKNSDVWLMKPQTSGDHRSHVAPFPYELPYRIIKAFSYIGETVLDPFLGSGTTILAAADLKRKCIGYEIEPEIVATAINNLQIYQTKMFT